MIDHALQRTKPWPPATDGSPSKLAVVTGAGSGIGLATLQWLCRAGYGVVAVGRRAESLDVALTTLCAGSYAVRLVLDVSDGAEVRQRLAELPRIDVLVAAAGVCRQARLADPQTLAVWREVLSINLDGVFYCIRAAQERMAAGGRIVAVSSGLGKQGRAGYAAYAAAKHGVLGLVRAAARELAPRGIAVNAVCPGWVDTPMAAADLEATACAQGLETTVVRAEAEAQIPVGRFVTAQEVAELIGWLVCTAPDSITGEAYNISGGEFSL